MKGLSKQADIALRGSAVAAWRRRPLSRRRLLQATGGLAIAAGLGTGSRTIPATAQGEVGGTLTMMCWQGYDGPNASMPWREEHGVEIQATYLGSNDEIFATLRAGGLGTIDIVTPYHGYVKNLYEAGLLQEIDYNRLPNTTDYIPLFQKPEWNTFDGKTYSAPFVWGTGPMIYNAEFIPEPPKEWMDVMKPEYTGRVVMTDDALGHYLIWNQVTGAEDPTQVTQEELDKTTDLLIEIKTKQARAFSPNMGDMADIMARGEAWLSTIGWEAVPEFPVAAGGRPALHPPRAGRLHLRRQLLHPAGGAESRHRLLLHRLHAQPGGAGDRDGRHGQRDGQREGHSAARRGDAGDLPLRRSGRDLQGRARLGLPAARRSGRRDRDLQRMAGGVGADARGIGRSVVDAASAAIVVEGVVKRFGQATALDGVSLRVEPGTFVSLLGPSGCGKTTLLRIIGGFETPDVGSVFIHGKRVDGLPPNRRPVNTVFQRYALFPHKTVFENIAFALAIRSVPAREQRERVRRMLDLVRLPGIEDRAPAQLSGGQAQRVSLARALIGQPQVLLLDEPLAALDLKLRKAMQLELRRIQEELGTSFLYVTHDQEEALTMSDLIILMNDGRIVQEGSPAEIYNHPATVFVSDFIGEANLLRGVITAQDGDLARVRVLDTDLEVRASGSGLGLDHEVIISVRPERLRVGRPGSANGVENRAPGKLQRRIFLGNIIRQYIALGPDLVVAAQTDVDDELLAEGDPVEVSWRADNTILLPGS